MLKNRKALVTLCWLAAAYAYFVALLPELGAARETHQVHAWAGTVCFAVLLLLFRTETAHSLLQTGDWKTKVPRPQLKLVATVLLLATVFLAVAYFLLPDASGRRYGLRLHAFTGLFAYNFGRWIYKGPSRGRA